MSGCERPFELSSSADRRLRYCSARCRDDAALARRRKARTAKVQDAELTWQSAARRSSLPAAPPPPTARRAAASRHIERADRLDSSGAAGDRGRCARARVDADPNDRPRRDGRPGGRPGAGEIVDAEVVAVDGREPEVSGRHQARCNQRRPLVRTRRVLEQMFKLTRSARVFVRRADRTSRRICSSAGDVHFARPYRSRCRPRAARHRRRDREPDRRGAARLFLRRLCVECRSRGGGWDRDPAADARGGCDLCIPGARPRQDRRR